MMATMLGMSAWAVDDLTLPTNGMTKNYQTSETSGTYTMKYNGEAGWYFYPYLDGSLYQSVTVTFGSAVTNVAAQPLKLKVCYDGKQDWEASSQDVTTGESSVTVDISSGEKITKIVLSRDWAETDPGDQVEFTLSSVVVGSRESATLTLPTGDLDILGKLASDGWGTDVSEGTISFKAQYGSALWTLNTPVADCYQGYELTFSAVPSLGSNIKVIYADGTEQNTYYGNWGTTCSADFTKTGGVSKIVVYGNNDTGTTYPYSITLTSAKLVRRTTNIGSAGYSTFSSALPIDFSLTDGITAYIAKKSGDVIKLVEVEKVPANTGVILKGAADTYPIAATNSSTDEISANELLVSDGTITGDESTIFVLANKSHGVGFYLLKSGETIPKGKAYLQIPAASLSRSIEFLGFDENGTTGIVEAFEGKPEDSIYYSLSGQRVDSPKKGLYIVKGKKVIMK